MCMTIPPLSPQSLSPFSPLFSFWICSPCRVHFQRTQLGPRAQNLPFVFLLPQSQTKFIQWQMWKGHRGQGDSCDQLSFLQNRCLDCSTSSWERAYSPRKQDQVRTNSTWSGPSLGTCGSFASLHTCIWLYTRALGSETHKAVFLCTSVLCRAFDLTDRSQDNPAPQPPQFNWLEMRKTSRCKLSSGKTP